MQAVAGREAQAQRAEGHARHLPGARFALTDVLGVPGDAKEAILFAVLANEAVAGRPVSIGAGRQRVPAVGLGKVSFPG